MLQQKGESQVSRYILNYRVSLEGKAQNTFEMLRESYYEHIHSKDNSGVELITDGGSENNNHIVNSFTEDPDIAIKKITAQVDIEFSNSMVEAYNKILKYRFLYRKQIPDFAALKRYLPGAVQEYNEIRPHYAQKYSLQ